MKQVILIAALISGSFANAHTVGTGGDALRKLFEQARTAAADSVGRLQWCSFAAGTRSEVSEWLLNNADKVAEDIKLSEHRWVVDDQPTCGFTNHSEKSPLYLSYPTCADTVGTNLNSAIFTLLHETAHHFGFSDENAADEIASAIMNADLSKTCPPQVADVFDSKICQGTDFSANDAKRFLAPGVTYAEFGSYSIYARFRDCTNLAGCSGWIDNANIYIRTYSSYSGTAYREKIGGPPHIIITTSTHQPYYNLSAIIPIDGGGSFNIFNQINNSFSYHSDTSKGLRLDGTDLLTQWSEDGLQLKSNCLWYSGKGSAWYGSKWQEYEFVIYGTH